MVYAIVESGGKQYRAVENSTIDVDRLPVESGQAITLEKVLLISDDEKAQVGSPYLTGVKVDASVIGHVKGPKLVIFKYEPKKRIRRKTGHRQEYTRLVIKNIVFDGKVNVLADSEKTVEKKTKPAVLKSKVEKQSAEKPAKKPASTSASKKPSKTSAVKAG